MGKLHIGLSKEFIIQLFVERVFSPEALSAMRAMKEQLPFREYLQTSGQYIYDRILETFGGVVRLQGIEQLESTIPAIVVYPHKASILDGTLLTVALLRRGLYSQAVARISPAGVPASGRDRLLEALEDYVIHLRQDKHGDREYGHVARQDAVDFLREVRGVLNAAGVVLVAPEGRTNPHQMGPPDPSFPGLMLRVGGALVPCTIEYHEPLSRDPIDGRLGNVFTRIDITFHRPVAIAPALPRDRAREVIDAAMATIAGGYLCAFRGGSYCSIDRCACQRSDWLKSVDEKFDPLCRYVLSHPELAQRAELLRELIEREFQVRLQDPSCLCGRAADGDEAGAEGLKRVVRQALRSGRREIPEN